MKKVLILALILTAVGCKSKKLSSSSAEKFQVENLAEVIAKKDLNTIYPDAQISEGTDLFEEGTVERAYSLLYPGTSDELLIIWEDENRTRIHQLRFDKNGRWQTNNGIKVGTTYDELERINGKPVKFYGFGWDYSGAVDWNEGKLANSNVRVFLAPEDTPPNQFIGDKIVEATPEEIDALDLKVRAVLYQQQ